MLSSRVLVLVVIVFCAIPQPSSTYTEGEECLKANEIPNISSPVKQPVDVIKIITKVCSYIQSSFLEYVSDFARDLMEKLSDDSSEEYFGRSLIPDDPYSAFQSVLKSIQLLRKGPSVPELIDFVLITVSRLVEQFVRVLEELKKVDPGKGQASVSKWFEQPVKMVLETIASPASRRARSLQALYDETNNLWSVPTKQLFSAVASMQADIMKDMLEKKAEKGPFEDQNIVVAGLYYMKDTYMKFAGHFGHPPVTMFALNHHEILKKLKEKDLGMANELVNLITFVIWSGTGFNMVYKELVKECWSTRHEIRYALIEGLEYDPKDMVPLKNLIDKANQNRSEACEQYKKVFGDRKTQDAYKFIAKQFSTLLHSTYDMYNPVRKDVKAVDFIAQTLLGDVSRSCFQWNVCRFGQVITQLQLNSSEVNLLVGLLVSGYSTFSGFMSTKTVAELGTPRMAKAIQDGMDHGCMEYLPRESECFNIGIFLEEYENVKKDMDILAKELKEKESSTREQSQETEEVVAEDEPLDTEQEVVAEEELEVSKEMEDKDQSHEEYGDSSKNLSSESEGKGRYERTTEGQEGEVYPETNFEEFQEHSPLRNG